MKGRRPSHGGNPARAPTRCATHPPRRILVVDDDSVICQLGAKVLSSYGYQVDTAEDGAAGWEALHAGNYDLLITDNSMPKVSGIELVKKLRSARMTLPVVLASGTIPTEALNQNSPLQLAATLLKPFTCGELLETVEKVLHTTDGAPEQIEPQPTLRSQPSAERLWL
jgi:DNA-binding response OmpR family regulator